MQESDADLRWLQDLLDVSFAGSGDHLRSAFDQEHRLSARALTERLPGLFEMHLAVATGDGAPLVAPVEGYLFRGRVCLGLPQQSVRARLIRQDRRVSASFVADDVSFIVHGSFVEIDELHEWWSDFDGATRRLYVDLLGDWFNEWLDDKIEREGRGLSGYIEPRVMFAKGASS
jgi:hypothetical protein